MHSKSNYSQRFSCGL